MVNGSQNGSKHRRSAIAQWSAHTNRLKGSSQRSFQPGYLSKYLHTSRPRYKCRYGKQVNSRRPLISAAFDILSTHKLPGTGSSLCQPPASLIYGPGQDLRSRCSRGSATQAAWEESVPGSGDLLLLHSSWSLELLILENFIEYKKMLE